MTRVWGTAPSGFCSCSPGLDSSKIASFEDVYHVRTFGFRGEALAALCELSTSLEITTRTATDAAATHLSYSQDGAIRLQRSVARPVGTTVSVAGLFAPLPVRHREFIRALRKQYTAMVALLHAFAMISRGVRFSVTNATTGSSKEAEKRYGVVGAAAAAAAPGAAGGARAAWQAAESGPPPASSKPGATQRVLSTSGSARLRDAVAELFGADFLASLVDLEVPLPTSAAAARRGLARGGGGDGGGAGGAAAAAAEAAAAEAEAGASEAAAPPAAAAAAPVRAAPAARVSGLVSKAGTGVGRSNNEKQFLYLNGRPVDLPRVTKALNECWRQYE